MKSMMKRNTFREIKKSFGRYFAILAIIALGVAFFSGLKITQSVMVHSADVYLKDLQFYDYRLVSTLGFTEENVEARKILVEKNLRLLVYIAKKFENTGIGVEDLISIGTIGLIKAIQTFKLDKKIKLATYASRCIENEILMYLRRTNKTKMEVSIDEPLNVDWDGNELLLSDILGTDSDVISKDIEDEIDRKMLNKAMETLSDREKLIIRLRFGIGGEESEEKTQKEVADLLGISQSYISRLEKKIIHRLKREMIKMQ